MSSKWLCVVKIFLIMAVVLTSAQAISDYETYYINQITDNESSINLSIPVGFETDFNEAQRLEELWQQNSSVIEDLIAVYENILARLQPGEYPVFRADVENRLGLAYLNRIHGDRAENTEIAIRHYNNSSLVWTHEAYPTKWAETEADLGNAYNDRIQGDRVENLKMALQHYNNSLQVYTLYAYPWNWASIEFNIGNIYLGIFRDDRSENAENFETAIEHFNGLLQVFTLETDPLNWALTEIDLGYAYLGRIRGDRATNLEVAILHFNSSLQVFTLDADQSLDADHHYWATIQRGLGNAYSDRIRGERAQNIEVAIQHYNNSSKIWTLDTNPIEWSITEKDLGDAYRNRIRGNHSENIEMAIQHYNNSRQGYTRDTYPVDWAIIENSLGAAYYDRIQGDRAENIKKAIQYYQNALMIEIESSSPRDFRQTQRELGNLYFGQGRWQEARDAYKAATAAGEQLYRSGVSAESKSGEVKENSVFYSNAAFAAVQLDKSNEALLILEQGKTRLLTEALSLKMIRPNGVPYFAWAKYERAAETYDKLQATQLPKDLQAQIEREQKSQEALGALDTAIIDVQRYAPSFQKDLALSDVLEILDNKTALISFCVTDKGSVVFVVTRSGGVKPVDVPGFNSTDLDQIIFKPDAQGNITGGWVGNMSQSSSSATLETIDQVRAELGQRLLKPAIAEIPHDVKNLILLPSGGLFLVPIHTAPISDGHELLCDRYVVSYAPSIKLLIETKEKAKERTGKGLYAAINPTGDLDFAPCEGENISRLFLDSRVDEGSNCTLTSVLNGTRDRAYLHFASHGEYNWNDPPQSALKLYNGSLLTLADLQENDSLLMSSRLVTLSACETGITDVLIGSADEYVGLPAGFMVSGAPCVVSSLWPVDDVSTSLLMERFYFNHITKGMDIPSSLQEAQRWVRNLTNSEVYEYVNECFGSSNSLKEKERLKHYKRLAIETPNATPFAHPYYWAGFTVNGV